MSIGNLLRVTVTLLICLPLASVATPRQDSVEQHQGHTYSSEDEQALITSLRDIKGQQLDGALKKLGALVEVNPTFKLAQLIYGDLLLAKTGAMTDFGYAYSSKQQDKITGLKSEAQSRWKHYSQLPHLDYIPSHLLEISPEIKHAIVIDLSKSRLYLYKNNAGELTLVSDHYISIGKNGAIKNIEGDKKTPVGIYHITSYLPPEELPDFYGAGAFPINYPNTLDKIKGKTGHGIWLHGTPTDTYSRPPRASDGCVTLSNTALEDFKKILNPGHTPVIIAESIDWVKKEKVSTLKQELNVALDSWRMDWQSMNPERYLKNYSDSFLSGKMDYNDWSTHKRRVNNQKKFIQVELDNVNIFSYPGENDLRIVTFKQKYNSSNYRHTSQKQQYWQRETDGVWRIIYEGPAS